MTDSILWNEDTPVTEFDIDVPAWINEDITAYAVAAINQGGCASGAYMPAVTYSTANQVMAEHGDAVMNYLDDCCVPYPDITNMNWSGIAVAFLSMAVEYWALSIEDELASAIEEAQEAQEAE